MTIGGSIDLPAGTVVAPCVYLVHRGPSLYPEPARFRPERFLTFKPSPSSGSRSAAGCAGASARPSPSTR